MLEASLIHCHLRTMILKGKPPYCFITWNLILLCLSLKLPCSGNFFPRLTFWFIVTLSFLWGPRWAFSTNIFQMNNLMMLTECLMYNIFTSITNRQVTVHTSPLNCGPYLTKLTSYIDLVNDIWWLFFAYNVPASTHSSMFCKITPMIKEKVSLFKGIEL